MNEIWETLEIKFKIILSVILWFFNKNVKRNDKNINLPQQVHDMYACLPLVNHSISNDVLVIDLEIILNRNL